MRYNFLDNWDIKRIEESKHDDDLLLGVIDDMLSNISDNSYDEGYSEGYNQGCLDMEDNEM